MSLSNSWPELLEEPALVAVLLPFRLEHGAVDDDPSVIRTRVRIRVGRKGGCQYGHAPRAPASRMAREGTAPMLAAVRSRALKIFKFKQIGSPRTGIGTVA